MPVVMIDELVKEGFELIQVEDQHPIETLAADRADEAFCEGVGPRCPNRRADDPDPAEALATVRGQVWQRSSATAGRAPVILDIGASMVDIHSENKDGTAPTFKGGFGFHPMFCFADATGECLSARLRPGNAIAAWLLDRHVQGGSGARTALRVQLVPCRMESC